MSLKPKSQADWETATAQWHEVHGLITPHCPPAEDLVELLQKVVYFGQLLETTLNEKHEEEKNEV